MVEFITSSLDSRSLEFKFKERVPHKQSECVAELRERERPSGSRVSLLANNHWLSQSR